VKTDWIQEFEWRRNKLRSLMSQHQIEVLLIYSHPMISDMWRHTVTDIVFWISDYDLIGEYALVVLPLKGEPILLISEAWELDRARERSWISDVRVSRHLGQDLREILSEGGLLQARIGLSGREFISASVYREIKKAFPDSTFEPASEITKDALFPKSEEEMERYRVGAEISEAAFQAIFEALRPGVTDLDLQAEAQYVMRSMGAEDMATLIGSGAQPTAMTSPSGRIIKEGDMLVLEPNPLYKSIFIEICRTVVVGKVSAERREKYDILIEAYDSAVRLIRPGVTCSTLARAMEDIIAVRGYAEYLRPPFSRVRGHGDVGGLQVIDGNMMKLVPGMVLTLHPNNYFPETGYMALGEPLLVTSDGCERLTKMPVKLYSTERQIRE
jgi:Xaa-Pro dipeptidase